MPKNQLTTYTKHIEDTYDLSFLRELDASDFAQSVHGKSDSLVSTQLTRLLQWPWAAGFPGGTSSRVPAGTMARWPSREACGTGQLQLLQICRAKLFASGRSKRLTNSSPWVQRNWAMGTAIFVERTPPVALRQREQ